MSILPCPRCAHSAQTGANFCDQCRLDLRTTERTISPDGFCWARQPDEVAVRIASVDLKAILLKRLAVAEGTRALLFQEEVLVEQLAPGPHTIESISERLKTLLRQAMFSVVLVDTSDVPLTIQNDRALCRDGVEVSFRADVAVRIRHPVDFYVNVMNGHVVRSQDLHDLVRPLLTAAFDNLVRDFRASELSSPDLEVIERMQDDIHAGLDGRLTASGLLLGRIDLIVFRNEGRDELLRLAAQFNQDLWLQRLERDRERLERERDQEWKRFLEQLERDESLASIENARSNRDFEQAYADLAHEANVSDLVRKERWKSLCHDYQAEKGDRETARRHFIAQLDWQRRTELQAIEHDFKLQSLRCRMEFDDLTRQREIEREDADHRGQLRRHWDDLQLELQADRARRDRKGGQFDAEMNRRQTAFDEDLRQAGRQADEGLRVMGLQFEQKATEKGAAVDRLRELVDIDDHIEDRELERGEQTKDAAHDRQRELAGDAHSRDLAAAQAERDFELKRIKVLGQLPAEALMSLSGSEQAGLIGQLQDTRLLQDQTPEQILARSAIGDPNVALALAEVFSGRGKSDEEHRQQIEALYDRMLRDHQAAADQQTAALKHALDTVERVSGRGLDAARDVGIAAAGRPAVVAPRGDLRPDPPREPACRECGERHTSEARFCQACGANRE